LVLLIYKKAVGGVLAQYTVTKIYMHWIEGMVARVVYPDAVFESLYLMYMYIVTLNPLLW